MRGPVLVLSLLLAGAPLAAAAREPAAVAETAVADVRVTVGGELARKTGEYGARDVDGLRDDLRDAVERALRRRGRLGHEGVRLELVIVDAAPNRPTMEQLARTPGLSMRSLAIGGATIEGVETGADGRTRPIRYRWWSDSLRDSAGSSTWTDAERAFDRFAADYADGKL
jgi:hypothetical protein